MRLVTVRRRRLSVREAVRKRTGCVRDAQSTVRNGLPHKTQKTRKGVRLKRGGKENYSPRTSRMARIEKGGREARDATREVWFTLFKPTLAKASAGKQHLIMGFGRNRFLFWVGPRCRSWQNIFLKRDNRNHVPWRLFPGQVCRPGFRDLFRYR